ncbi:cadherin-like domain-containing protein [Pantanalinema rosaneae CENA516]|uniref:cadherin-like domain-containing protein n=1 Tax=Pantanalinema rosaneae TaxID=1620701 RepID=UPI003D6E5F75
MPDNVGNTLSQAQGIVLGSVAKTFTDSVEFDDNDYYRFTLNSRSSFNLALTGLSANADVQVLNSSGAIVTDSDNIALSSANGGTLPEIINTVLDPGTYYIRVFPGPPVNPADPANTTPSTNYSLNVLADNGSRTDILWRDYATGQNFIWRMNNTSLLSTDSLLTVTGGLTWRIGGAADFNNDGVSDIVWRNQQDGREGVWLMSGTVAASYAPLLTYNDPRWEIRGVGDFNQDGHPDLVWRSRSQGITGIWLLNGLNLISSVVLPALGSSWDLQGVGDLNGDNRPDLLWRSGLNNAVWFMNGTNLVSSASLVSEEILTKQMQGTGDFNGDGLTDILWRDFATGANEVWLMNGILRSAIVQLPTLVGTETTSIAPYQRNVPIVRRDIAGNTRASALQIGPLNGNGIYQDSVDAATDANDYYQFSLGSRTSLNLALTGPNAGPLNSNLDVQITDSFGTIVFQSAQGGTSPESIVGDLDPGTYYIRVFAQAGNSLYQLSLQANNQPRLATNVPLTLSEGTSATIASTLLLVTDENNPPEQVRYTLVTPPDLAIGSLSLNGAAITTGNTFSQADINAGRLTYQQNGSETLTDNFVFSVSDGQGGAIAATSFSIRVIPVNDAPVLLTNLGVTLSEGATAVIANTLLLASDVDNPPVQLIYSLTNLPANGTLSLNSVAITAGQTFTQAAIDSGALSYRHNGSETLSDSFTFAVVDAGGLGTTPPTQVFSITVTPVNDPPVLVTNAALTINQDATVPLTSTLLRATDAEFLTLPDQIVYTIVTAPQNGSLFRNNTVTTSFTQADLDNGRVSYDHNGTNTNSDSFTFTISDGVNTVTPASTFNITVTRANFPPVLTSNTGLTLAEGATTTIGAGQLQVTDPDTATPQLVYTLGSLPVNGQVKRLGTALTAGQTFSQDDIDQGRIEYQQNGSETLTDLFTFTVSDGVGGSIASQTFSINITPVNDAPILLSSTGLTVSEGSVADITNALLLSSDPDNLASQITYTIATPPSNGTLLLSGTATSSFTQADVNGGNLRYLQNGSEATADSFTFNVSDGTTSAIGTGTFNIAVIPVNDPPGLAQNTSLTLSEGAASAITDSVLLITDNDGPGPITYTVGTAPLNGILRRGTTTLSAGLTFTQVDVTSGQLTYTHNGSETTLDSFTFTASDGSTGTIPLATFNIAVTPVNDVPVLLSNAGVTLDEGGVIDITSSLLRVSDGDNPPLSSLVYTVTPPSNGTLLLAGAPVTSFTQADINSGQLRYQHNGSETIADNFVFTVSDGQGGTIAANTFNIVINPVNDAPGVAVNTGIGLLEGSAGNVINNTVLSITDNDGPGPIVYTLGTGPARGVLTRSGVTLSAGQTFTQADLTASLIAYSHDGSETTSDTFTFTASDSSTGVVPLRTFSLTVFPTNDAPVITVPAAQTVNEDVPLVFTGNTRISISDADAGSALITVNVSAVGGTISLGSTGGLTVNGNNTGFVNLRGSLAAINTALNNLTYRGTPNFNGTGSITVFVTDEGNTGAGGEQTNTRTIDVNVLPINDAPTLTITPTTVTVLEDTPLNLTGITVTDVDSGTNAVRVSVVAGRGTLTVGNAGGVTFVDDTVNNASTIVFEGVIADIQTALSSLAYQGNPDVNGTDTITIQVNDQGATGAPGPLSVTRSLTVNVTPVNDRPTFTGGSNVVINEDAGAQTIAGWATNILRGPATATDEVTQTVTFNVTTDNAALFSTAPTVDSATGNLIFTAAPNANGTANVTVTLRDNGGTANGGVDTSTPYVFTIVVNPVNDAPTFTPGSNTLTILEDAGPQTVNWATAISAGPPNEATQTLSFNVASSNPSLFTVAPTISPTGVLTYTTAPNANGVAVVTVTLQDSGGTENGGVDTSSPPRIFTINVTPVNDAPTLTVPGAQTVDEDTNLTITGVSVTDIDAGTSPIRVNLTVTNGVLNVSSLPGLTITGNNSRIVSITGSVDNVNTALGNFNYLGNANFNGTDTLTIVANDNGNTGNGGALTATQTIGITVNAINDAPLLTVPTSLTVAEDTNLTLSGITITDVDSGASTIEIALTATQGTITLGTVPPGVAVSDNGTSNVTLIGTLTDLRTALANSTLRYLGNPDYNGADIITVTVNDRGNTGFGGPLTVTRDINVTVTPVNDPPTLTLPGAQTVSEDTDLVLTGINGIALTDVDSGTSPIRVSIGVTSGTLILASTNGITFVSGSNNNRTATFTGTVEDVRAALGTLTYRPNANYNGADTLTVSINDQGNTGAGLAGTASGTVAISVTAVNDPPVLVTNTALTVSEGAPPRTISNSLLRTTDVDNTNVQLVYTLVTAPNPVNGTLLLNSTVLSAGQTFTQDDINNSRIAYAHSGSENPTDSFVFRVSDGNVTLPDATFSIVVNPINDIPVVINNLPLTLSEGATSTIANTVLRVTDPDNTTAQLRYTLTNTPTSGNLRLNGTNLTANQTFTQADVDAGRISYRHNGSETTSDSFVFNVSDGAGGSTGTRVFNISVTPVNDAPVVLSNGPLTINEGAITTITNSILRTSDPDNLTSAIRYTLPTAPVFGTLRRSGVVLSANDVFSQQDIDNGLITYQHNGSEDLSDVFVFQVSDGIAPAINRIFNITVNPVNDAPVLVNNTGISLDASTVSVTEINNSQLLVTDVDNTTAQLVYTVRSLPSAGTLRRNGGVLNVGQTFTQADIDAGIITYDYPGFGGSDTNFQFEVSDGGPGGTLSIAFFDISFFFSDS